MTNRFKIVITFLGLASASALYSCSGQETPPAKHKPSQDSSQVQPLAEPEIQSGKYNDLARFFAGLPPLKDSVLKLMCKDSFWVKHRMVMDRGFNSIEKNRFAYIRKWRDVELKDANSEGIKTMFYPLSGPDFLNAFNLFPHHENYILVALESSGKIKDLTKLKKPEVAQYLNHISGSLVDIFNRSYFITKRMSGDFSRWKIEGNLPTMMVFLARTGNNILDIRRVAIDSLGDLHSFGLNESIPALYISKGVKIDFKHEQDTLTRHLYYFSTNLGDMEFDRMPGLDVNKGFVKFVEGFAPFNSFCKAASYLLHYGTFNTARNLVLDHSAHHLQDDSGIAYRYFKKNQWRFKYYGKYSRPIDEFRKIYEKDLEADMMADSLNVKPLPFKYGYHWGKGTVSMLYARKVVTKK